jgi:hypothetical protein
LPNPLGGIEGGKEIVINNKITTKIKTNLTFEIITKFESQYLRVDHGFETIIIFYYDIASPFQTFSLSL